MDNAIINFILNNFIISTIIIVTLATIRLTCVLIVLKIDKELSNNALIDITLTLLRTFLIPEIVIIYYIIKKEDVYIN